ncbi:MAG: hypothetical protein NC453_22850 [Muribaculum sp.]|nr:hypothetical protein [Muribaculum sp.]
MTDNFNTYINRIDSEAWRELWVSKGTLLRIRGMVVTFSILFFSILIVSCSQHDDLQLFLDSANEKIINSNFDDAQSELLKAESLVTSNSSIQDKERLERLKGLNYLELRVMDKAKVSLRKALDYSKQMNDTSRIIQNSFNLGLCNNTIDEAIEIYENVVELAKDREQSLLPDALEKLAQGYIFKQDFQRAQLSLDRAYRLAGGNSVMSQQIAFTQCELWLAEDSLDLALSGFRSIQADSCSMVGKLSRAHHIYDILYEKGDYKNALAYKDSVQQFTDSIRNIDGANRVQRIEEDYKQNVEKEQTRFNTLLYSSVGVIVIIAIILFFVLKNLRLKRGQVLLSNQIAELNVKLSALQSKEESDVYAAVNNDTDDIMLLIMEKFRLSMEIFKTQPQYDLLKKLNLIRDFDSANKQEVKEVSAEIIGRFSDACSNLRQTVPAMTNDDCLLCSMCLCGCSKEVVSAMMGSSEEAVRRRKSRIKQKLPENLFSFFFK